MSEVNDVKRQADTTQFMDIFGSLMISALLYITIASLQLLSSAVLEGIM